MWAIRVIIIGLFPDMTELLVEKKETFIAILAMMKFIRAIEQGIADRYSEGKMRCPTHLSIGQECPPAVLSQLLDSADLAVSSHRAHAHYLGKGGDPAAMLAEIYGKSAGCSKGRGGSMHLIDESAGFMGSTAIVGNTIPIGVGLALAKKIKAEAGIAVVYLGDGATEEGVFYEAANFAAVQKLPVLFVCENNLYSVYSGLECRQPKGRKIYQMVQGMGLHAVHCDGNDAEQSFAVLSDAVDKVRSGHGPVFVELATYRWLEHCGHNYDNDIGYRCEQEFLQWKDREPIAALERRLLALNLVDEHAISVQQQSVSEKVKKAFEFAENAPFPAPEEAFSAVFAPGGARD